MRFYHGTAHNATPLSSSSAESMTSCQLEAGQVTWYHRQHSHYSTRGIYHLQLHNCQCNVHHCCIAHGVHRLRRTLVTMAEQQPTSTCCTRQQRPALDVHDKLHSSQFKAPQVNNAQSPKADNRSCKKLAVAVQTGPEGLSAPCMRHALLDSQTFRSLATQLQTSNRRSCSAHPQCVFHATNNQIASAHTAAA